MKNIFRLLVCILTGFILGCKEQHNPYNGFVLPDSSTYNRIIFEILKQDTVFIDKGLLKSEYISANLNKLEIRFSTPNRNISELPILSIPSTEILYFELKYYKIVDLKNSQIDSLFIAFQNDSARRLQIDREIIDSIKLASDETIKKSREKEYFGYFQFALPILNQSKTRALVRAEFVCPRLCGQGMVYILEKVSNKWILKLAKIAWVS
jgi:hypothetical protein